jgi:hypothetical protein
MRNGFFFSGSIDDVEDAIIAEYDLLVWTERERERQEWIYLAEFIYKENLNFIQRTKNQQKNNRQQHLSSEKLLWCQKTPMKKK